MNNNPKFKQALLGIYKDGCKKFNIRTTPKVILRKDAENGALTLGRTAYYDPNDLTIVLYISNRHPKDILRSFAHELIHHVQNERGDLHLGDSSDPQYAQNDEHLRKMEKEAYLQGNLLMRDFEDNFKYQQE
jgi:Zn-dependent peptidase ImmA (M78 family)